MSFLKKLSSVVSGKAGRDSDAHYEYVRCARCGESIQVRVDTVNELTPRYSGDQVGYYVRKGVLGAGKRRCFQMIVVELGFTADKQLAERTIAGGEFITKEEYQAEHPDIERAA